MTDSTGSSSTCDPTRLRAARGRGRALLEAHGWDLGFWAVLDEGEIEDCVAVIGHRRGTKHRRGLGDRAPARRAHR